MKISELPTELHIELGEEAIHRDNVYFGIISSNVLKKLHDEFGDALFFENIRDFLGLGEYRAGRSTPNQEIIKTILEQPEKMLERNNGIVIRADRIIIDDSRKKLTLTRGSVINGCQTTMCIVDNAKETCFVPVKIVETSNSWDVAKAANYQNEVRELDLDLARSIRPQLAMRAASVTGVNIQTSEKSAFQIIDEIYSRKATYEETRLLYIGLFSRNPNNLYAANYTELMKPVVDKFYEDDPFNEKTL